MKTFESCNNLCSNYDCDNETGFPQNMIKPLHFQCTFLLQESAIFWGWNVTFLMHKNFCRVVGLSRSNRNIPKDAPYLHEKSQSRNILRSSCNSDNANNFFQIISKMMIFKFQILVEKLPIFKSSSDVFVMMSNFC